MDDPEHGYPRERAELYHAHTSEYYREDLEFYVDLASGAAGPTLELACGTGRVYLELCRAGVDADGFDLSAGALSVLRERAAEAGVEPSVWVADVRSFAVDRAYGLAICPFNALQHLHSVDDQRAALEGVHDALRPGGTFAFDVFVPSFEVICGTYGEWDAATVTVDGETYRTRSRTRIVDELEQVFAVENEAEDPDGELVYATEHRLKMLPKREVELLVRQSPFESWTVTGDFADESLADGHDTQVWRLEKVGG